MKKRLILAAAAALSMSFAGLAQARDLNWSVSIGDPYIGAVISNGSGHGHGRGYGYAAPVYVAPPVIYAPPPRVVYQRPYVYAPYGHVPYSYAHSGRDRWDHRHGGRDRHDRDDRRGWRDGDRRDRGDRDDDRGHRDERRQRH